MGQSRVESEGVTKILNLRNNGRRRRRSCWSNRIKLFPERSRARLWRCLGPRRNHLSIAEQKGQYRSDDMSYMCLDADPLVLAAQMRITFRTSSGPRTLLNLSKDVNKEDLGTLLFGVARPLQSTHYAQLALVSMGALRKHANGQRQSCRLRFFS